MSDKKQLIIGLTGRAGVGKDCVGDFLSQQENFARYAFANPIKAAISMTFGVEPEYIEDRELKETVLPDLGKSPRELMQLFGTEFARKMIADDIWVRMGERCLNSFNAGPEYHHLDGIVITDVRFDNEAELIKRYGGVIIEVVRDSAESVAAHSSENGINRDLIDYTLENNHDFDTLEVKIMELLGRIEDDVNGVSDAVILAEASNQ